MMNPHLCGVHIIFMNNSRVISLNKDQRLVKMINKIIFLSIWILFLFTDASPLLAAEVNLSWDAPTQGGPVLGYMVFSSTISEDYSNAISLDAYEKTSVTVSGLKGNTKYYFIVKAYNAAGMGPSSNEVLLSSLAPEAPTILTVTAGDSTLSLTWTASDGASAYEVFYSMTNNTTAPSPFSIGEISGTSANIYSLANGTKYYVWVKAINSAGDSVFSASASGTPVAALTVPNAPTIQTVTVGDGTLSLIWTASAGASAYGVWYATADNSSAAIQRGGDITDTSYLITGLTNGTRYYLWVKAKNSAGYSTFSTSANETPVADTNSDAGGGGGGCFIATAAYGSQFEPHVKVLREFRDSYLMQTELGKAFVNLYYKYSPELADVIAKNDTLKLATRWSLVPVVAIAYAMLHTSSMEKLNIILLGIILMMGCSVYALTWFKASR
jgi:hypothetical protein